MLPVPFDLTGVFTDQKLFLEPNGRRRDMPPTTDTARRMHLAEARDALVRVLTNGRESPHRQGSLPHRTDGHRPYISPLQISTQTRQTNTFCIISGQTNIEKTCKITIKV